MTHSVSSLFWCKCHELSAYLVSYIAMMVREDDLMGFLFKLPVFCVRIGSICAIAGSVVQARKCH